MAIGSINLDVGKPRRALFIQATEPANYPPLINASTLMADAGWEVTFLSAPIAGNILKLPTHPRITVRATRIRPSHVMSKKDYVRYGVAVAHSARSLRPDIVYASDPLGAGPGLLAARLAGARLVYHEHDSPMKGTLRGWLARQRAAAAQRADVVIFPNQARADIAQAELDLSADRVRVIWNLPRRAELPELVPSSESPLRLYYHGGVTPDRLPEAVIEAVVRFNGRVCLRIVGSEMPGARGYLARLLQCERGRNPKPLVEYAGQIILRSDLLTAAARSHVGLAFMPTKSDDVNMRHMTGASNKPFDYMAAGLALLVSDITDWRRVFVQPGFARPVNPNDPDSTAAALEWFLNHPAERRALAARGRAKIESDWNYESAFAPIIAELNSLQRSGSCNCDQY
jgi:glycosyltransferase involved in cell wall biosynthesis